MLTSILFKCLPWILSAGGCFASIALGKSNVKLRIEAKKNNQRIKVMQTQMKENGLLEIEKQEVDANAARIKENLHTVTADRYNSKLSDMPK